MSTSSRLMPQVSSALRVCRKHGSLRSCKTRSDSSAGCCEVGPRSVTESTRLCEGRSPGSTPGEGTDGELTLEPDGTAAAWGTAANSGGLQFQVGSTPTGVSDSEVCMRGLIRRGRRHVFLSDSGWKGAFRERHLTMATSVRQLWLAQPAEHQTDTLAVTGSTPVPPTQAHTLCLTSAGGRRTFVWSAVMSLTDSMRS